MYRRNGKLNKKEEINMTVINNAGNINPILPQNVSDLTTAKGKDAAAPAASTVAAPADTVVISKTAAVISKAATALNALPAVRADLVAKAVQERLVSNSRIPANLLAQRMLFEDMK
jgi:hypothetical protein